MFDPFGDFAIRGYLRNTRGYKTTSAVKRFEHSQYRERVAAARAALVPLDHVGYDALLATHSRLFSTVYPWAGQDRMALTPDAAVVKGRVRFAPPREIRRATEYALAMGNDLSEMAAKPGTIMGQLAFAHPFLEGNGRTFLTVFTELARRAALSLDWHRVDHRQYLSELTKEIMLPGDGHLDAFFRPFIAPNPDCVLIPDHQPIFAAPPASARTVKADPPVLRSAPLTDERLED